MNTKSNMLCDVCEAPFRHPLTAKAIAQGWRTVEYTVGTRHFVQTHRPSCPIGDDGPALIGRPS
jgi:hypothetical protein